MKRTFNYTGRKKIERKDAAITLHTHGTGWMFDADLRLSKYNFPRNAEVWIEAHRQNLWMQFPWGTVSAARPAADRQLTEFDVPDGVLFRVRVVQPLGNDHHKLLGEADGIPFVKAGEAADRRRPLIWPDPDDLGQVLWKLDFDSEPPRLLVHRDARPTYSDFARSPHFLALVYPEVLRRILTHVLVDDEWTEEDEDGWQADWMRFARNLGVSWPPPPPDQIPDRLTWADEAISAFARRHQLKTMLDLAIEGES